MANFEPEEEVVYVVGFVPGCTSCEEDKESIAGNSVHPEGVVVMIDQRVQTTHDHEAAKDGRPCVIKQLGLCENCCGAGYQGKSKCNNTIEGTVIEHYMETETYFVCSTCRDTWCSHCGVFEEKGDVCDS